MSLLGAEEWMTLKGNVFSIDKVQFSLFNSDTNKNQFSIENYGTFKNI